MHGAGSPQCVPSESLRDVAGGKATLGMNLALGVLSGEQASRAGSLRFSLSYFQHPIDPADGDSELGKDHQPGFEFLLYQLCCISGTSPFWFLPL